MNTLTSEKTMSIGEYWSGISQVMEQFFADEKNATDLYLATDMIKGTTDVGKKIILVGNGGSSAVAEHMAIDLTKNAGLKAMAFSGSPMLTTFANDYGYEKVYQKAIEAFGDERDVLIAISSSGTSANILNACEAAKEKNMQIITFSGFDSGNPLRRQGDINFWVDSRAFGYVELLHNLLIHYMNDAIIGSVEYMIR